jgi:hypothetical protein
MVLAKPTNACDDKGSFYTEVVDRTGKAAGCQGKVYKKV